MQSWFKRLLHWGGGALAIGGVAFVALRVREYGHDIQFGRLNGAAWLTVACFGLVYGLANFMLAVAWCDLLATFGARASPRWAIKTYGITQLAKYVPGNIFHLASRQALGMASGIPAWSLLKSSMWELALLCVAGAVYGCLALPLLLQELPSTGAFVAFVSSAGLIALGLKSFLGPRTMRAFWLYVIFLAVSGLLFVGVMTVIVGRAGDVDWSTLCGAYVLAWLAGLLTPGAPAGVGVRELVLLLLLKGAMPEADLVLGVMLGRVITVAGDVGIFGIAALMDGSPSPVSTS